MQLMRNQLKNCAQFFNVEEKQKNIPIKEMLKIASFFEPLGIPK